MSNFGKKLSNYNEVTGNTIITSTKNQDVFAENYAKIGDAEYQAEVEKKQPVTMFPITFPIPQQLHKELSLLGEACNKSVERIAQEIFLEACCSE